MDTNSTLRTRSFPNYFKKVGLALIFLILLIAIAMKMLGVTLAPGTKELVRVVFKNAGLLGLLLIALSKDKVEDEMILYIKLRTMAASFMFGSILIIGDSFIELISTGHGTGISGPRVVVAMLCYYIAMFYFAKRNLK